MTKRWFLGLKWWLPLLAMQVMQGEVPKSSLAPNCGGVSKASLESNCGGCQKHSPPSPQVRTFGKERTLHESAEGEGVAEGTKLHKGAGGDTKLACRKTMWLGTRVTEGCRRQHKTCMSQSDVARHKGAGGDTKLACRKTMWLGTRVPEGCRRQHKTCMLQSDVARHEGARGDTKLACHKAMWLGIGVPKATQILHVAKQCG
ncbi:unnamed protein product [Prunus armeniaca]